MDAKNIPDSNTDNAPDKAIETTQRNDSHAKRGIFVFIGFVLVVAGWLTMMLNEWVSFGCVLAGLIVSCIGVRVPAGARRNLAITSIIAASVLLIVLAIFAIILYIV